MLKNEENLRKGVKSSINISNEKDRKLIESMVRGHIIDKPIPFDELIIAINNSNGRVLKYYIDHFAIYFDPTGRYISDYKRVNKKPNLNPNETREKLNTKEAQKIKEKSNTKETLMYRGLPVETKRKPSTLTSPEKVKMYRGVPVLS